MGKNSVFICNCSWFQPFKIVYNLRRFYITPKETTWKIPVEYIKKEIRRGLIHITRKKKINEIGGKAIRDERRDKRLQDIGEIINTNW